MNSLTKTLVANAHLRSLIMSCGAVLAGLTASIVRGGVSIFPALLTLLFAMFLQTASNLRYGFYDMKYSSGENLGDHISADGRGIRSDRDRKMFLMKLGSNAFALLALTVGIPLFEFIGWIGIAYIVVINVLLYFNFAGPGALVRTPWGILITFALFGPVAVSGTALIQDYDNTYWTPIVVNSLISGFMAANAHISIMYSRFEEDFKNGKRTLTVSHGKTVTKVVYIVNAVAASALFCVRPYLLGFDNYWVFPIVALFFIATSIWEESLMSHSDRTSKMRLTKITMYQYVVVVAVLLAVVAYGMEDFKFNLIHLV